MRALAVFGLVAIMSPSAANAQWLTQDGDEAADSSGNRTYTTPGGAEAVAAKLLSAMRLEQRQRDLCWELGCLVIVNASKIHQVEGFYVGEQRRGRASWSQNQFGKPLLPRRATFRFKMNGRDCERPVRFVFRDSRTRERIEVSDRVNFCPTPHVDSLLKLNVVRPNVIIE